MSSWNEYVDSVIDAAKGSIDKAAIFALNGGVPWTPNHPQAIRPTTAEMKIIDAGMVDESPRGFIKKGYIQIKDIKYKFLRYDEDDNLVIARSKGKGMIVIQASKTAILIAHCPEGKNQGNALKAVKHIVEYLESIGYDESVVTNKVADVILADILDTEFRKRRAIGVENAVAGNYSKPVGNSIAQPSIAHHDNATGHANTGMSNAGLTAALICPIVLLVIFLDPDL